MKIGGDLNRQRAKQNPDHEAHVEIEKSGKERRPMSGFEEFLAVHLASQKSKRRREGRSRATARMPNDRVRAAGQTEASRPGEIQF
jgi:hypothetical protein